MNVTVYCGSSMGSDPDYKKAAEALGLWIAGNGHTLVYGGGNIGLMGIIADTVLENGGKVIGIIPDFLLHCEQGARRPSHLGSGALHVHPEESMMNLGCFYRHAGRHRNSGGNHGSADPQETGADGETGHFCTISTDITNPFAAHFARWWRRNSCRRRRWNCLSSWQMWTNWMKL